MVASFDVWLHRATTKVYYYVITIAVIDRFLLNASPDNKTTSSN